MNWHTQLLTYGYAHFPGLTPALLALAAREAIDMDLRDNYDSERQLEYDNRSYCPGLLGAPPIMDLLLRSPIILGHSAAVNTAEIDRIAVYFRIWLRDLGERRWECLTNIWEGWKI